MKQPLAVAIIATSFAISIATAPDDPLRLIDQCDREDDPRPSARIVVAATITADSLIHGAVPMRSDPSYPLQLRRLTLDVEHVLRGGPLPRSLTAYYFTWAGGYTGHAPLGSWKPGRRRVFWLRRDGRLLRTACDGPDNCTTGVFSGAHPGYRPDPRKPIEYALADLLLTRGEGAVDDRSFASRILQGVPDQGLQAYVVEKLRRLARTERGEVQPAACQMLSIYEADQIRPTRSTTDRCPPCC